MKKENEHVLYQYSTIASLAIGNFNGVFQMDKIMGDNDFGIGTFDALDGEMIVLDGEIFQMLSDGSIKRKKPETTTSPYLSLCHYVPMHTIAVVDSKLDKGQVEALIEEKMISANIFYAVKIVGEFSSISTRTVARQQEPYPRLLQATGDQSVNRQAGQTGIIIGFFTPYFANKIGVEGFHFHFINSDHSYGGHVFDFELKQATISWMQLDRMDLRLPGDDANYLQHHQKDSRLLNEIKQAEASRK